MSKFPDAAPDARRLGKAPERSNFTQYCNVLSQLLKDKRGSGSLSLGMAGKMESRGISFVLAGVLFHHMPNLFGSHTNLSNQYCVPEHESKGYSSNI
ncbi:hypothetical protein K1719_016370 [Acacia pycnantha]|nr:hypothetical protein K1719_016370 [Acacia pycnantha]